MADSKISDLTSLPSPDLGDEFVIVDISADETKKISKLELNQSLDHDELLNLSNDSHSQYHNDARGDARYYTEAELDAGQLDTRYYTETESDANFEPKNTNIQSHIGSSSNPHSVSKSQVGLSSVPNLDTSTTANITDSSNKRFVTDAEKTVIGNTSGTNTGDQDLSGKENVITATTSADYYRGDKTFQPLNKAAVGLSNVPNVDATARANHTGTQLASTVSDFDTQVAVTALLKANNLSGLTNAATARTNLGLGNIDNTSDVNKPVSTAQASADTAVQNFAIQRANHTGSQAISTVTSLQSSLDAKRSFNRITVGNANYTIASTDRYIATTATFTAQRTFTLPAANALPAGAELIVADEFGAINGSNNLLVARAGADTINGSASPISISTSFAWRRFITDGTSKWVFDAGILRASNNLSDVQNAALARANLGVPEPSDIQIFTSSGTWTKPAGAKNVRVAMFSGSGGGGSGRKGATGTVRGGGGAGGSSSGVVLSFNANNLGATESVVVGAAGVGGASQTTNSTNGNAGTSGGATTFGSIVSTGTTGGGAAGSASTANGGSASWGTGSTYTLVGAAAGANSNGAGGAGNAGTSPSGSASFASAGSGGGVNAANVSGAGGNGGKFNTSMIMNTAAFGAGGANTGGAGGDSIVTNFYLFGFLFATGAGGGGGSLASNGGKGGDGMGGSGGGGGGGCTDTLGDSGVGGNGISGYAVVITYF